MSTIRMRNTRECQMCALRSWEIPYTDAAPILDYLASLGLDPAETIRGYRENRGGIRFQSGIGYAIISSDLLGGSADGRALHDFEKWFKAKYGQHVEFIRTGTPRQTICRSCSHDIAY